MFPIIIYFFVLTYKENFALFLKTLSAEILYTISSTYWIIVYTLGIVSYTISEFIFIRILEYIISTLLLRNKEDNQLNIFHSLG